jgi:hypothetical protein
MNVGGRREGRGDTQFSGGYPPTLSDLGAVIRWYWPWRFLALTCFVLVVAVLGALADAAFVTSLIGAFLLMALLFVLGPRHR